MPLDVWLHQEYGACAYIYIYSLFESVSVRGPRVCVCVRVCVCLAYVGEFHPMLLQGWRLYPRKAFLNSAVTGSYQTESCHKASFLSEGTEGVQMLLYAWVKVDDSV